MPACIFHRQICADNASLLQYLRGQIPDMGQVQRNLFLKERSLDVTRPDHWYKNHREDRLGSPKNGTVSGLLLTAFDSLSGELIEARGNRLHIRSGKTGDWQDIVTRVPPLVLVSYAMYKHFMAPEYHRQAVLAYADVVIRPNIDNTVLLSPFCPRLEAMAQNQDSLSDLHVHLNGTTEYDLVWLDALARPGRFYRAIRLVELEEPVREQYEQIEPGLTARECYRRLCLAGDLRYRMTTSLYGGHQSTGSSPSKPIFNREEHPVRAFLLSPRYEDEICEALFYIHAFRYLSLRPNQAFARKLHLYLLLYGFFNQLMVQQVEQNGFDQFQKITLNEARAPAEKEYTRRFKQLSGKNGQDLAFVEGRFAPKKTVRENFKLLHSITRGYAEFQNDRQFSLFRSKAVKGSKPPRLTLTAHFIKKPDKTPSQLTVRHHNLRATVERQAKSLITARSVSPYLKAHLLGADAAANELHAPPEVFAPVFRYLRSHGMGCFTFHAGEDFTHLLSGIRAVYETRTFLGLRQGDRIGHATAVGITPSFWIHAMNGPMVICQGEWMDNIVYLLDLLLQNGGCDHVLGKLEMEIVDLGHKIYGPSSYSPSDYISAQRMRYLDPLKTLDNSQSIHDCLDTKQWSEWQHAEREQQNSETGHAIFRAYHSKPVRENWNHKITIQVDNDQTVNAKLLEKAQQWTIDELNANHVALETMPTSNLRISFYKDLSDHHLFRWLGLTTNAFETNPSVCLSSDDPGIFSTHIRNEFCHVYETLVYKKRLSRDQAYTILKQLDENARIFRFR